MFIFQFIFNVQGNENYALDLLLRNYEEEDIVTVRSEIPKVIYEVKFKKHRYFPDIYIPKDNLIIEVKSLWTYKHKLFINILKALAVRKLGFQYEVWIFDKKGDRIYVI